MPVKQIEKYHWRREHCSTWSAAMAVARHRATRTGRRQQVRAAGVMQRWWIVSEIEGAA